MIKRCIFLGVVIAIGLALAGCYTDYGPVAVEPTPVAAPVEASVMQLGDRVTVTVYGEPNLSGVYDVNPTGNMDLPLIGSMRVVGRTPTEVERAIEAIRRAAQTGRIGEGKIFVSNIEEAIRIRTGESGLDAI